MKGFFFGIAARKLGYKCAQPDAANSVAKPNPAVVVVAASANDDEDMAIAPTITAANKAQTTSATANQLERASITFGHLENFHKHWIATTALLATSRWHSEQAKQNRSVPESKDWELKNVSGHYTDHVRRTISQLLQCKGYNNCGIETDWQQVHIGPEDVRVAYADDRAALLWTMTFSAAREWESRNMAYEASPVKRQILLLHSDAAHHTEFLSVLKRDAANSAKLLGVEEDWAVPYQKRNLWNRTDVKQFTLCCKQELWKNTSRLSCLNRARRNETVQENEYMNALKTKREQRWH